MSLYWYARIEIAVDWRQWLFGFNYHPEIGVGFNVFFGPVRIGRTFFPKYVAGRYE